MIVLPWPSNKLSPNGRLHWAQVAKAKKSARQEAWALTKASGLRPASNLHLTFCPPDRRRYDIDGLLSRCKAYLDGIADAWGVDDNTFRLSMERGEVVPGGRVIVEVQG